MISIFSCAAYEHFDTIFASCKQLERGINESLKNKEYGSIRYLTAQFSALTLVEPKVPEIKNQHTLSLVLDVDGISVADLAKVLIQEMPHPIVPTSLVEDLAGVFREKGWMN